MIPKRFALLLACTLILFAGCKKIDADLVIKTTKGDLYIRLYDDTPIHKQNFLKLAQEGFYDGVAFHRIVKNFMIQAGDPKSKDENYKGKLGAGMPEYTLAPEFRTAHIHKRGALAAARQNEDINPGRRSSDTQFFIIHGTLYTDADLDSIQALITDRELKRGLKQYLESPAFDWARAELKAAETLHKRNPKAAKAHEQMVQDSLLVMQRAWVAGQAPFKYDAVQRQAYKEQGGAPWLDQNYTVFGEVVGGQDTIDRIANADMIPDSERPAERIEILKVEILKK